MSRVLNAKVYYYTSWYMKNVWPKRRLFFQKKFSTQNNGIDWIFYLLTGLISVTYLSEPDPGGM
ncbi:hypothetical protein BDF21DRAFT_454120 [Thamnidium elegans]|nr:hypothetical protein BDF21DRAFT_454120 [Thamnidium elegans]